jgi:hypothetical protein
MYRSAVIIIQFFGNEPCYDKTFWRDFQFMSDWNSTRKRHVIHSSFLNQIVNLDI